MINAEELKNAISNLKTPVNLKPALPSGLQKQMLITELKEFLTNKELKNNEWKSNTRVFITEEIKEFERHTMSVKSKTDYIITSQIKHRVLNDKEYVNFLRSIRNFKFSSRTHFEFITNILPFTKELLEKRFRLNQVYIDDFLVIRHKEIVREKN